MKNKDLHSSEIKNSEFDKQNKPDDTNIRSESILESCSNNLTHSIEHPQLGNSETDIKNQCLALISKLYCNSLLPKNVVQVFVESKNSFVVDSYLPFVRERILLWLQEFDLGPKLENIKTEISTTLKSYASPKN